jgi:hypothetical protein
MALQDQQTADPANSKQSTDNHSGDSSSNSDASEYIYTPPSPVSSMTSNSTSTSGSAISPPQASEANISVREYIYFLPYPLPPHTPIPYSIHLPAKNPLHLPTTQFEPTSTLVLTSPGHVFVDLRFYKPLKPGQTPLPNTAEPERLEWGFAGTSSSVPTQDQHAGEGEKPWPNVSHSTWFHFVDSRWPVGSSEIPVDEGDMYPISDTLTLEFGHMYQPDLKAVKTHEEMWRDVDVLSTTKSGKKTCVVLRLQDDKAGARGIVVRVGQFCQGIVMLKSRCTVERWECDGGSGGSAQAAFGSTAINAHQGHLMGHGTGSATGNIKTENEGWRRTARIGDLFLPCAVTWRMEVLCVGGKVKYHDYEWVVEEVWEW